MKNKIKKWFFKTCPKSGRIVGINKKNVMLKICFPLLGLAALVWFLHRQVSGDYQRLVYIINDY